MPVFRFVTWIIIIHFSISLSSSQHWDFSMEADEALVEVEVGAPEKLGADEDPLASAAHRALDLAVKYCSRSCER